MQKLLVALSIATFLFILPMATSAAGLVPCGGTDQAPCQTCDVVKLTNNVVRWLVLVLGTFAAIIIVYAGVRLVTSGGNQAAMEKAKDMITNVIIGYVIILAAWLAIDYALKAIIDEGAFGVWNEVQCTTTDRPEYNPDKIILGFGSPIPVGGSGEQACRALSSGGYDCSVQYNSCRSKGGIASTNTSVTPNTVTCMNPSQPGGGGTGGSAGTNDVGGGVQCSPSNSACSVSALQAVGMTSKQANIMSCIAMTESTGNPGISSNSSTACGTFQVLVGTWNDVSTGACSSFSNCTNARCNAQVATTLVRRSGYSSWTCPGCNKKAQACVSRYGG